MKKLIALLLILAMIFSLSSCGLFDSLTGGSDSEMSTSEKANDDDKEENTEENEVKDPYASLKECLENNEQILLYSGNTDEANSSIFINEEGGIVFSYKFTSDIGSEIIALVDLDYSSQYSDIIVTIPLSSKTYYANGKIDKETFSNSNPQIIDAVYSDENGKAPEIDISELVKIIVSNNLLFTTLTVNECDADITMKDLGFKNY